MHTEYRERITQHRTQSEMNRVSELNQSAKVKNNNKKWDESENNNLILIYP